MYNFSPPSLILSKTINMCAVLAVFAVACYNGATFYIDVIGHKYYTDKEVQLKENKMKSK